MPQYAVLAEGWLTDARGHAKHYVPAKEGKEPVTIDLSEAQADYLLRSEQIGVMKPQASASALPQAKKPV